MKEEDSIESVAGVEKTVWDVKAPPRDNPLLLPPVMNTGLPWRMGLGYDEPLPGFYLRRNRPPVV